MAFLLGLLSFFLMFFLAGNVEGVIGLGVMGGYFLISGGLLARGNPQAVRKDWVRILALNWALLLAAAVALGVEPNKSAVLELLGTAILAVACSYAGAALAARAARQRLA